MCSLGVWAWAGHDLLTRAHGFAPANTLMPYTYSFLIFLTVESYLVFADIPDGMTLTGAAIIMLSWPDHLETCADSTNPSLTLTFWHGLH
jgi:hypothetical protein